MTKPNGRNRNRPDGGEFKVPRRKTDPINYKTGSKSKQLRTIRIEIQNVPESVVDEEAFLIHRLIDAKRSRLNDEASFKGWMVGMRDWLDKGIAKIDPNWENKDAGEKMRNWYGEAIVAIEYGFYTLRGKHKLELKKGLLQMKVFLEKLLNRLEDKDGA